MTYYYNPEVRLLLVNESQEEVEVLYDFNQNKFKAPLIGLRPPYYIAPKYAPYDPII